MKLVQLNMIDGSTVDEDGIETEQTKPVAINVEAIRAFYNRRGGKPGTRLTFTDGGGFAVSEDASTVAMRLGHDELIEVLRPVSNVVPITSEAVN